MHKSTILLLMRQQIIGMVNLSIAAAIGEANTIVKMPESVQQDHFGGVHGHKRQGHSYRQYQDPITDTCHAFHFDKYRYRYLGEHQYRFNRRFDLAAMFQRLCSSAARTGK